MNKSFNFHKHPKIKNENNTKTNKIIRDNNKKINNSMIRTSNGKFLFDFKNKNIKTFLNDKDSERELLYKKNQSPSKKETNITSRNDSKMLFNLKNSLQTPLVKSNIVFNNIPNNRKRYSVSICNNNIEFNKKEKNDTKDMNKSQYFKYRKEICKSSNIDALKKRHQLYKENFITNKNESIKNRVEYMKDIINTGPKKELEQNTFNKNNNISNYFNILNSNKNNNRRNQQNLNEIQSYKEKNLFKTKINNKNINKRNGYLYSQNNSNALFLDKSNKNNINKENQSNFNSSQDKGRDKGKKSSKIYLNLPKIQNMNLQKSLNLKTERTKRPVNALNSILDKNAKNTKEKLPLKKTTTINIYNNKINNINNIILNDKNKLEDKENHNKYNSNKNEESESLKSSNYETRNNIIKHNKSNLYNKEDNKQLKSIKTITSNYESNNDNKNNKQLKNTKQNIEDNIIKKIYSNDNHLIRRLSVNYVKNYFNQFPINKYKSENFNETERKIRAKILKINYLKQDKLIKNNLTKIKTEITQKLFEELSKKITNDIEEEKNKKNNENKKNCEFNNEFMIKEKMEYIKKVNKKTGKLLTKLKKFNYISKNKLIQIYEKNVSHYSKITIYESKYFFFKYLFDDYFNYISCIILEKKYNFWNEKKKYNLLNIYNKNNVSNSIIYTFNKKNDYYFNSLLLQNVLMEKDKIQKYFLNNKKIDKTIKQINDLIIQIKGEITVKKSGNRKIIFNINANESEENNAINNNSNRNKSKYISYEMIKKSEYSDTDKYDKSGYDTREILPGNLKFNYKSKNDNNINNNNNNSKNLLTKKKTFNNDLFHLTYSNIITNNNNMNINNKIEAIKNIEKNYNLTLIDKDKIEKKYNDNITKNNDYIFKRKKNVKTIINPTIISPKKEINFLKGNYMFKNMVDYRTDEIKTTIKKNIKSPVEMLFYQIKEHDFDEFCELFERKQIDLNARNPDNDSFLIYAVKCKALNFVLYLLKRGIDVNLENKFGNTALHYAFSDQNYEIADILLQHGADEFKINVFGLTPWQCLGDKKI